MKTQIAVSILLLLLATAILAVAPTSMQTIPAGSKIYVAPGDGFDTFLAAALHEQKIAVTVVAEKNTANYILTYCGEASIFLTQTDTNGEIVFVYIVNKQNSVLGKRSLAENCASHFKEVVQ